MIRLGGLGLLLLGASRCGEGGTAPPPEPDDTGAVDADDSAGTDLGETGREDTGDSGEPEETGDTEPDETGWCDATPYVVRETGDTGEPGPTAYLADSAEPLERFLDTGWDDCDEAATTDEGDPLLRCMGVTFDASDYAYGHDQGDAEWLGDLDGDGLDDFRLSFEGVHHVFYGGGAWMTAGYDADLEASADARGDESVDPRVLLGGGDLDGDGLTDLLLASEVSDEADLGVLFGTGTRWAGEVSDWGTGEFWSGTGVDDEHWSGDGVGMGTSAPERRVHVADMDGDGTDDVVFSPFGGDGGEEDNPFDGWAIMVIRGGAALAPTGRLADAATWRFRETERIQDGEWEGYYVWQEFGVPVGDFDGDGANELVVGSADWWTDEPVRRYSIVSAAELPPCDYDVQDASKADIMGEGRAHTAWWNNGGENYGPIPRRVGDLDGDGREDLVLVDTVPGAGAVLWIVYAGERYTRFGGELASNTDRIEWGSIDASIDYNWTPHTTGVETSDLDGDGIDELLVGGTYNAPSETIHPVRAHVDVVAGAVGGLRGVHTVHDFAATAIVTDVGHEQAYPARGRGDADGDGLDDLLLVTEGWDPSFDRDGTMVGAFLNERGALVLGADLVPYL